MGHSQLSTPLSIWLWRILRQSTPHIPQAGLERKGQGATPQTLTFSLPGFQAIPNQYWLSQKKKKKKSINSPQTQARGQGNGMGKDRWRKLGQLWPVTGESGPGLVPFPFLAGKGPWAPCLNPKCTPPPQKSSGSDCSTWIYMEKNPRDQGKDRCRKQSFPVALLPVICRCWTRSGGQKAAVGGWDGVFSSQPPPLICKVHNEASTFLT